ncbi:glycosyltransferase family 4 protein [Faecalibacterium sp. I3-3-33]|uniref:glycosyltransferase family 4 protein n=1 Tax=Faecalibacterium sp. I3-3-33 TaxID=2929492 RepID=UPI002014DD83|nr:glycosyltransferase family 4 protein [Faecalibacterium sp. I3-3-33]UQK46743.1 glycosyltransferase family 4 protein [Faecalibacterium sp. I3-3-33]
MKVLMWMDGSFDRRTPSEHLLVAIVQALYANGHTVHIIQQNTGGPLDVLPKELVDLGVTTDCVPCQMAAKGNLTGRYLAGLGYIWRCRKAIWKHRDCEAVFSQSSNAAGVMAFMVKRLLPKARLTYNVQDIFPENAAYIGSAKGIVYKILSAEQRYAYRHADQIITISEDMKELLIEKGADSQKTEVVYNWSYTDSLYRYEDVYSEKIAKFLSTDKFNVVYAGNIGTMQNVDVVVETAKLMQDEEDVHFHIFGDGMYKERLQHEAEGLSNISFWPMQPSELAPSIYAMADVNVIPLAPNIYRTALPSKTATCIACGKPIVFCIGRESKLLNILEQNGLCAFVPSDDAKCLAESVLNLKKSLKDRTFLDEKFHQYFEREKNSNEYSRLITGA